MIVNIFRLTWCLTRTAWNTATQLLASCGDMDKRFILRNMGTASKLPLYERLLAKMAVPRNGVYILLDDGEYPNYFNPRYKRALYMNIRVGGLEEMSPQHILDIMGKPDCEHFVWISPSVLNGNEFYATWVLAHELQHVIQDSNHPELAKVGTFLRYALPAMKTDAQLNQLDFPGELDAELKAKEMAISLLGVESYRAFVSNEVLHNNANDYYKKLEILEISRPSYKEATLLLICSSKDAFIDQQKRLNEKGKNFDFDIERLCV
ncbi:MAG: hypothetical protein LUQ22_07250 [Methanotrichaceae archaeon]|nr:hypothetical protein [Methanotrichaceae archaeon]